MPALTIGFRILIAVAVPSAALLAAAGLVVSMAMETATRAERTEDGLKLVAAGGDLVHALQRERGLSAGYLGSRGDEAFRTRMEAARREADISAAGFAERRQAYAEGAALPGVEAAADATLALLTELQARRAEISAEEVSREDAAAWYTSAIRNLIDLDAALDAGMNNSSADGRLLSAYTALAEAKESAGLERAMGAIGFGSGIFTRDVYERFFAMGVQQGIFFDTFRANATPALSAQLDALLNGPLEEEMVRLRQEARNASSGFGADAVSGADWFAASTARIDAMKKIEVNVQAAMIAAAARSRQEANWLLLVEFAIVAASVLIAVGAGLLVSRNVSRSLRTLGEAVQRASRGEDMRIEPAMLERQDEIGIFARNAQDVQFATDRARRIIGALDVVDAPVAVANERNG
ncbi:MAG: nitrate- and nitrite sensing domain-containing protein, partial [Pseudomonadota bacterium]